MKIYTAPYYSKSALAELDEKEVHFPFSDDDATYNGLYHQYELTNAYFLERDRNLELELDGNSPDKVKNFLADLRRKVYTFIYTRNKSTMRQMNYLIAVKALNGYSKYEYRQAFLEAMFYEGCYLINNGNIAEISGVDLDTMQNISNDVLRKQDRDMSKECIGILTTLGLNFYGRYRFIPQGEDW